ncbi:MAG: 5'-deoxynucleotidase [Clostridia bacterium]|nr:5'-deoxynucleotidase [Clostridia bacterium]
MKNNYYSMLFRMKYINRWALMRNLRPETLSEHSLETAFIAHCLAIIAKRRFGEDINPEKVAVTALFHDTAEVITGDLPTPVKYYNDDIKSAYKSIEAAAEDKLLELIPEDLRDDFTPLYRPDEATERYVKAADKFSALIKCREELSLGNKEFAAAAKSSEKVIKALKLPAADVFLKEFVPAFESALDESME